MLSAKGFLFVCLFLLKVDIVNPCYKLLSQLQDYPVAKLFWSQNFIDMIHNVFLVRGTIITYSKGDNTVLLSLCVQMQSQVLMYHLISR